MSDRRDARFISRALILESAPSSGERSLSGEQGRSRDYKELKPSGASLMIIKERRSAARLELSRCAEGEAQHERPPARGVEPGSVAVEGDEAGEDLIRRDGLISIRERVSAKPEPSAAVKDQPMEDQRLSPPKEEDLPEPWSRPSERREEHTVSTLDPGTHRLAVDNKRDQLILLEAREEVIKLRRGARAFTVSLDFSLAVFAHSPSLPRGC